ncbi:hypothetical protein QFC20_006177 [Naganishia adeliensis]|uniref:Uncharacterized protein n=1 Tax=Naganishia adeliensis TaxID=92952 RepID=A0ACC2VEI4_9TREE|nr:hypothetical protein QFC20_006177 [Naganishia adeliensis]
MSDGILHENVPKFITDVAGFLENDDNNDRIQQLQKAAHKMQVQVKQNELKLQREYLKNLRESVKDIPGFWPFTLLRNETIMTACTSKQDLDAFGYLKDVELIQDPMDFRTFGLKFTFAENPYFSNTELVKKYVLAADIKDEKINGDDELLDALAAFDPEMDLDSLPVEINWKSDAQNLIKLQPREIPTLDETNEDDMEMEGDMGSFFHFFTEAEDPMEIGTEIARDILPQAMSYFLGLAGAGNEDEELDTDSDDDESDDEDAQAEIDLEELENKRPTKKAKRS